MQVIVAINYNRDHETEVCGVCRTQDEARSILEKVRGEPLRVLPDGQVERFAADELPDLCGYAKRFELPDEAGEEFTRGYIAGLSAFAWSKDGVQYVGTCGMTLAEALAAGPQWALGD